MRRLATISFATAVVVGLGALATVAMTNERDLAFAFGVAPQRVAAVMQPREEACQRNVFVDADFQGVRFQVGTFMRAGVPLAVRVQRQGRTIARGRLAGNYPDVSLPIVRLDPEVTKDQRVAVCIRNIGDRRVALFGGFAPAKERTRLTVGGEPESTALTLDFVRAESRSAAAVLPAMVRRAGLFTAGWMADWVYWLLGGLVLLGAPVLILRAVRSAASGEDSTG